MTYGGASADEARSVIQTSDGGYAIAGSTQSFGHGGWDMWLVKTNSIGQIQWNQTYGTPNDDNAYQVIQLNDGGYAIVGSTWNQTRSALDLYMVRTDSTGNLIWALDYIPSSSGGSSDWGVAFSVIQTSDGNFMLCGSIRDHPLHPTYDYDAWVIKVSSTGQVLWDKPYFSSLDDGSSKIILTNDGGYAFVGATQSNFGQGGKMWLVKIDANGNQQWVSTFGGTGGKTDNAMSLVQTQDGGYAIAGYTYSFGAVGADFCLIKTNSLGNLTWVKTYGGTGDDEAYSLVQTSDGGYALAGYTNSYGAGGYDVWLIKTDSFGNIQWNTTYGGTGNDYAYSLIITNDGGFAIAGGTNSFGAGNEDFFLVKTAGINPTPTPTATPTPTPTLLAPTLSVTCQSSASYSNFKVSITGSLTIGGAGISGVLVLLSYSVNEGNSWIGLTTAGTDSNGNFDAVWYPSASGNYILNAYWAGNATLSDANTTISFAVLPYQTQSVFSVSSNSTISEFAFNSTSNELSFTVSGPPGTTGYVDVNIPKSLVSDVSSLKVYLDGNQLTYAVESQGDSWLLSFTYHHSTHQVTITMGTVSSTPLKQSQLLEIVIAGAIIAAIAIVAGFLVVRKNKDKKLKPNTAA